MDSASCLGIPTPLWKHNAHCDQVKDGQIILKGDAPDEVFVSGWLKGDQVPVFAEVDGSKG